MIMEAIPSPQSVGREFVRQYYTLLNKAPDHLHRFYNNNSSFVHGGLDPHNREATMVIGQKQIYNKIQQLRFNDCHAKISQVDAQSTLGGGVVVQVTGELSNNGEPMRRFTQTFVLAAQSPKKYYVHNDIFRYQDLIADDENEVENRSDNDDEHDDGTTALVVDGNNQQSDQQQQQQPPPPQHQTPPQQPQQQQNIYYQQIGNVQSYPQPTQPIQLNGVVQHDELLQTIPPSNNNIAINSINNNTNAHTPIQIQSAQQQIIQVDQLANVISSQTTTVTNDLENSASPVLQEDEQVTDVNASVGVDSDAKDDLNSEQNNLNSEEVLSSKQLSNEPKTYAQFFKSDNFSNNLSSYPTAAAANRSANATNPLGPLRSSTRTNPVRERRTSNANQFSDNHQLFLGNVPHHATEDELKVMFSKFGTVVDLRIHSKNGPKLSGQRAPQNYGFITYDDPESVQNCLANMPLYYPDGSAEGQKLNVEEKKARMRNDNMNNIDRMDRDRSERLGRTISGGTRNNGDRDRGGMGMNHNSGNRTTNPRTGGSRSFNNRNDRPQGPRGNNSSSTNNNPPSSSAGNTGGYGRR